MINSNTNNSLCILVFVVTLGQVFNGSYISSASASSYNNHSHEYESSYRSGSFNSFPINTDIASEPTVVGMISPSSKTSSNKITSQIKTSAPPKSRQLNAHVLAKFEESVNRGLKTGVLETEKLKSPKDIKYLQSGSKEKSNTDSVEKPQLIHEVSKISKGDKEMLTTKALFYQEVSDLGPRDHTQQSQNAGKPSTQLVVLVISAVFAAVVVTGLIRWRVKKRAEAKCMNTSTPHVNTTCATRSRTSTYASGETDARLTSTDVYTDPEIQSTLCTMTRVYRQPACLPNSHTFGTENLSSASQSVTSSDTELNNICTVAGGNDFERSTQLQSCVDSTSSHCPLEMSQGIMPSIMETWRNFNREWVGRRWLERLNFQPVHQEEAFESTETDAKSSALNPSSEQVNGSINENEESVTNETNDPSLSRQDEQTQTTVESLEETINTEFYYDHQQQQSIMRNSLHNEQSENRNGASFSSMCPVSTRFTDTPRTRRQNRSRQRRVAERQRMNSHYFLGRVNPNTFPRTMTNAFTIHEDTDRPLLVQSRQTLERFPSVLAPPTYNSSSPLQPPQTVSFSSPEGVLLEQLPDGSQIIFLPPPTLPSYYNDTPPPYTTTNNEH